MGSRLVSREFDRINSYTPSHVEVLAVGADYPADLVLVHNENSKYLLNTGSMNSYKGLIENKDFRRFIKNFIDYALN